MSQLAISCRHTVAKTVSRSLRHLFKKSHLNMFHSKHTTTKIAHYMRSLRKIIISFKTRMILIYKMHSLCFKIAKTIIFLRREWFLIAQDLRLVIRGEDKGTRSFWRSKARVCSRASVFPWTINKAIGPISSNNCRSHTAAMIKRRSKVARKLCQLSKSWP